MNRLELNGTWKLTYNQINDKTIFWNRWIDATVPGDVHLDLMNEHLICDPLVSDNNKKIEWIEEVEWWYKKDFYVAKQPTQRVELVCEGLDLTADLWVNDKKVGSSNNMFVVHRFDITNALVVGCNEIKIRLDVGFEATKGKDLDKFKLTWAPYEARRPWMRKAQQCFYWDVAPRLITCGIWRDVYIEFLDSVVLRDVYGTSVHDENSAKIKVSYELENYGSEERHNINVKIKKDDFCIEKQIEVELLDGINIGELELEIQNPKLWWPNGLGEQNLYEIEVALIDGQKNQLAQKKFKHGIRSIEILKEPLNDKEKSFTFVVNGVKIFCRGGDWVPSDAIYARINKEKEHEMLRLAKEANFNMMRVWGGGIYPDASFYDSCDSLGIMVWQDFMYACGYYPDDEEDFCIGAEVETEKIIRKFRNHAALAAWCGNNETYMMHQRINKDGFFGGYKIYSQIIPNLISKLDAKTYYHPSSPYPGPWPGQEVEGTQHVWSYALGYHDMKTTGECAFSEKEKQQIMDLWNYAEDNYKFVSEFGIFCPSNLSSIQKFMGEHPVDLDIEGEIYFHHRNYYESTGFIGEMLRLYYGRKESYSPLEYTMAGQVMQGEILKHIFEVLRNRMYVCSGSLFWEYNDTWGHIGYAPVDYYLSVKPVYYYMRDAFVPLHVTIIENGSSVTVLNETRTDKSLDVKYGIMDFDGTLLVSEESKVSVGQGEVNTVANLSVELGKLKSEKSSFVFASIYENGKLLDRTRQFVAPIPEIDLPKSTLEFHTTKLDATHWQVDLKTENFEWLVKLDSEEYYVYSDNAFDLWPGESKTIKITTQTELYRLNLNVYSMNQFV
ncbi:hypothetical protein LQZ18_01845 [Lachnospiraceae bacterium ZAX-1]